MYAVSSVGHVRRLSEEYRIMDSGLLTIGYGHEHEHIQLEIDTHHFYSWLSEKAQIPYEIYGRCLSLRIFYI